MTQTEFDPLATWRQGNVPSTVPDRFAGAAPFVATETSYEAAKAIEPSRARLKERVFAIIDTDGPVTDEYIAMATGLSPNTARPRRIELERAGRIEKAGHQLTSAGRKAVAWRVVTED